MKIEINENQDGELSIIKKDISKTIKLWAIILFIVFLLLLIFIDLIPIIFNNYSTFPLQTLNLLESIKSILENILPLLFVAIFIEPITQLLSEIEKRLALKSGRKTLQDELRPIEYQLERLNRMNDSINQFPEIVHISCSYTETDWSELLYSSKEVDLCMFYANNEWERKFAPVFSNYLQKGGILNLYLPNPSEISSKYIADTQVHDEVSKKIIDTMRMFKNIQPKENNNLNIKILAKGFNYMFARISNSNKKFLFSPYANTYEKSGSPVIIFNEELARKEMVQFIEHELDFIKQTSKKIPDFESSQHIVWKEQRNRVFLSSSLKCDAGCSFCYINSLIKIEKHQPLTRGEITLLCSSIYSNKRFIPGSNGTDILLGAFNDPFASDNITATLDIMRFFSMFNNYIHIASRYNFPDKYLNEIKKYSNVIINYSISSLDNNIELKNFDARFSSAKKLIGDNVKVALFLRPVLYQKTLKDLNNIIKKAKEAKIEVITVGGLYIDKYIKEKLSNIGLSFKNEKYIDKHFVLDDKAVLKKLKINDLDEIAEKLKKNEFKVFRSSDERIDYFKKN